MTDEEFTIQMAGLAARYPSLHIDTSLVRDDGEVIFTIPADDLAVFDEELIDND